MAIDDCSFADGATLKCLVAALGRAQVPTGEIVRLN